MVELIEAGADTQVRFEIDDEAVERYLVAVLAAKKEKAPQPLPPIDLFQDSAGRLWIGDGWHRFVTWKKAGMLTVPAIVRPGSKRDAIEWGLGANKLHGLNLSNRDKRRHVTLMVKDSQWSRWSDRRIADHIGVAPSFVGRIRKEIEEAKRKAAEVRVPALAVAPVEANGKVHAVAARSPRTPSGGQGNLGEDAISDEDEPEPKAAPAVKAAAEGESIEKLAQPYLEGIASLKTVKKAFDKLAKDEERGGHLAKVITHFDQSLNDAMGLLRQQSPHCSCGRCKGEGCQFCARTGFWTKFVFEGKKRE